jgi:SAM-dependent methyltransferase
MGAVEQPIVGGTAPRTATRTAGKLAGFANKYVSAIETQAESARYLDVGCGNGFITDFVAGAFAEVYGIDMEPLRLDEFREKTAGNSKYHIAQMSASEMTFDDNFFGFITSFEVLEHVPDLAGSADEIVRVLKPGGVLVISVPQVWFPIENHGMRWRGKDLEKKIPLLPYLRPLHRKYSLARVFSSGEMDRLFVSRGLKCLATGYAAPQFERAAAREGSLESKVAFVRPLLDKCETIPGLRALTGVSMLKAYRKPKER